MNRKFRLAYLTDGIFPYARGGMARFSTKLLRALMRTGRFDADLFFPAVPPPASADCPELAMVSRVYAVPWRSLPRFPGHYVWENYRFSRTISGILDPASFDGIYAHGLTAWHYLLSRSTARPPVVANLHGLGPYTIPRSLPELLRAAPLRLPFRAIARRADCLVSFGTYTTSALISRLGVSPPRIAEIPNAVDAAWVDRANRERPRGTAQEPFQFLFVSRYDPCKGLEFFLNAARAFPECRFSVVGNTPRRVARKYRRSANLRFAGEVWNEAELLAHYVRSDCVVVPSLSDHMPTVVLEAMACGVPVIGSRVGLIPDMLACGAGILVTPGDPGELRNAIARMTRLSQRERAEMGEAGVRQIVERYTWEKVAEKTAAVLRKLA